MKQCPITDLIKKIDCLCPHWHTKAYYGFGDPVGLGSLKDFPIVTMPAHVLLFFLSAGQVYKLQADGSIEWLEDEEVYWIHDIDLVSQLRIKGMRGYPE
jgi:hypothetical protein